MKRMIMAALAALVIAGTASAQGANPPPQKDADQNQPQQTTISGKLELIDGMIGLKSGGNSYYAPRLRMLVGFVKDLQEGAAVSLTGYAYPIPESAGKVFFAATKLSFGGKDYDLGSGNGPWGRGRGMGMQGPGRGGMMRGSMSGAMWGCPPW